MRRIDVEEAGCPMNAEFISINFKRERGSP